MGSEVSVENSLRSTAEMIRKVGLAAWERCGWLGWQPVTLLPTISVIVLTPWLHPRDASRPLCSAGVGFFGLVLSLCEVMRSVRGNRVACAWPPACSYRGVGRRGSLSASPQGDPQVRTFERWDMKLVDSPLDGRHTLCVILKRPGDRYSCWKSSRPGAGSVCHRLDMLVSGCPTSGSALLHF